MVVPALTAAAGDDERHDQDGVSTDGGMAMNIVVHNKKSGFIKWIYYALIVTAVFISLAGGSSHAAKMTQQKFTSPDEAFEKLITVLKSNDEHQLAALFGPGVKNIFPADREANARMRDRFLNAYDEKHSLEKKGPNRAILHVGHNNWPWPVPVVKTGSHWRFDTQAGIKEIAARRIGKNEVAAVQVCLAYVDSQMEYARQHTVNGISEYAQQLTGDANKQNGLCSDTKDGEKPSPLGPLIASACKKGMKTVLQPGVGLSPYYGYYYKILKSQGSAAPGGGYNYVVDSKMIGGFALVAYPAIYGVTGIMTFIVSKDDIVYQKDLGKNTEKIAEAMIEYNPDSTWVKAE